MSFLQKAKEAANQVAAQARQGTEVPASGWGQPPAAADPAAAGPVPGAPVSADPAAATAAAAPPPAPATGWTLPAAAAAARPPGAATGWTLPAPAPAGTDGDATRTQFAGAAAGAKEAFGFAKKGLAGVIDKIDAGTMADIIIKATALQEKTNRALRLKGSPYRIAEISISASLPPAVAFSISRIDDPEEEVTGVELSSTEILAETGMSPTLEVEGAQIDPTPTPTGP